MGNLGKQKAANPIWELRQLVTDSVASGASFDGTERKVWEIVRKTMRKSSCRRTEQVEIADGKTLQRSSESVHATVRSICSQHSFEQLTYSPGKYKKVELYSISARMQLPEHQWSYLLQELSQLFCVGIQSSVQELRSNLER